jgi:hypothetical protein
MPRFKHTYDTLALKKLKIITGEKNRIDSKFYQKYLSTI